MSARADVLVALACSKLSQLKLKRSLGLLRNHHNVVTYLIVKLARSILVSCFAYDFAHFFCWLYARQAQPFFGPTDIFDVNANFH